MPSGIADLAAAAATLPPVLKLAWVGIGLWTLAQVLWYRRVHVAPAPPPPKMRSDSSRRVAVARKSGPVPVLPTGGSPHFLSELGLHDPEESTTESAYR